MQPSTISMQPFLFDCIKVRRCCLNTFCTVCSDIRAKVNLNQIHPLALQLQFIWFLFSERGFTRTNSRPAGEFPPDLREIHKKYLKKTKRNNRKMLLRTREINRPYFHLKHFVNKAFLHQFLSKENQWKPCVAEAWVSLCLQVEYSLGPTYFMLFTHSAVHDWSSEGSASEPWLIGASRAAGPARTGLPAWTKPSGARLVFRSS